MPWPPSTWTIAGKAAAISSPKSGKWVQASTITSILAPSAFSIMGRIAS
jgi:hypothetical protein